MNNNDSRNAPAVRQRVCRDGPLGSVAAIDRRGDGMGRSATGEGRGRRRWRAKLAVGGLLTAADPLAVAGPAGAELISESSTVSLTFVPNGGGAVTCRLEASGSHETSSTNG
jgi:hypothetical protein